MSKKRGNGHQIFKKFRENFVTKLSTGQVTAGCDNGDRRRGGFRSGAAPQGGGGAQAEASLRWTRVERGEIFTHNPIKGIDQWEKRWSESGLPLTYSRWDFQTNQCRPHSVRGLEVLSEPCFVIWKQELFPNSGIARHSFMKKSRKLACHIVSSNIEIVSFPLGIVALFEKIYNREPILTVVSNIGENVQ